MSMSGPDSPGALAAPPDVPPTPPPRRRRRRRTIVLIVIAVLVALATIAQRTQLNLYAISPGSAQAVDPLVHVPPDRAHPVRGQILLTDVLVSQVNLLDYLPERWSSDTDLISADELLGPDIPPDQLVAQGYLEMAQAQASAKAAALRTLGYAVPERDAGAVIDSVSGNVPASDKLQVGQIVKTVNGAPVSSVCDFIEAMHPYGPGQPVHLGVEQSTPTSNGILLPGTVKGVTVTPIKRPASEEGPTGCPGAPETPPGYIGVSVETQQNFTYPFPVHVDTTDIGGPSAGLAMTLGIIDKLSNGELAGVRPSRRPGPSPRTAPWATSGGAAEDHCRRTRRGHGILRATGRTGGGPVQADRRAQDFRRVDPVGSAPRPPKTGWPRTPLGLHKNILSVPDFAVGSP